MFFPLFISPSQAFFGPLSNSDLRFPDIFFIPQQLLLSTVDNGCPQPRGEYSLQGLCV